VRLHSVQHRQAALSPQRSNRQQLLDGTIRCLELLPPDQITARVIARESGANLASISYHFGSKDQLVTEAMVATLDRWLDQIADTLATIDAADPAARFDQAAKLITRTRTEHLGLLKTFISSLSVALGDDEVRALLADGFARTWPLLASVLAAGEDQAGRDAAGLVLSMFYGQMIQATLDPALALDEKRMRKALRRLQGLLPY
jgi:AcrR family transcriptional regulator